MKITYMMIASRKVKSELLEGKTFYLFLRLRNIYSDGLHRYRKYQKGRVYILTIHKTYKGKEYYFLEQEHRIKRSRIAFLFQNHPT